MVWRTKYGRFTTINISKYEHFTGLLQPFWNRWWSLIWLDLIDAIYSQIAPFFALNRIFFTANEEAILRAKQPIRFKAFKVTDQIARKWKTRSIMWQILQLFFLNSYFSPQKMDMTLISDRLSTASIKYLNWSCPAFGRFQNGCNKVVIEPRVVQFWSEIILVISNHTYDFSPNCTPLSAITNINR